MSVKNRDRTTLQSDYLSAKVKKGGGEKMKLKMEIEYSEKIQFFQVKLSSNAFTNFSVDFSKMFIVPYITFCVSTNTVTV